MNKVLSLVSATAMAAALALPAAANDVPLNTVTGGEGQEQASGQALAAGGLVTGTALVGAIAVVAVVAAASDDDESSTTVTAE